MELTPAVRDLPESQQMRLAKVRDQMLLDARRALRDYAGDLSVQAEALWQKVWTAREKPNEVRRLVDSFYSRSTARLYESVTDLIADAALYAERHDEVLRAYHVAQRHQLKDRPGPADVKPLGDYEAYFKLNYGRPGANAAAAYAMREARTEVEKDALRTELERARKQRNPGALAEAKGALRELKHGPYPITEGDRIAVEHLRRFEGTKGLSKRLHGAAVADSREASRVMLRAIRETENAGRAARELQRHLKDSGKVFGKNDRMPKLMQELLGAGQNLRELPGSLDAQEKWNEVLGKLKGYQRGLKPGATVQNGYLELLQRLQDPKFQMGQLENQVKHWTYWKQRYRAEAYISTEQATAFRVAQLENNAGKSWIVGYRWVLGGKAHAAWVKRGPGKLSAFGGKHCACEALNGEILSPDVAREYGVNGAHPHCRCALVEVYDHEKMLAAPISAAEEAWYDQEFGGDAA